MDPAAIAADATATTPGTSPPPAPNASGAMPGDESLTCEQIYAQGMAESQRDQQALKQRNDELRVQSRTTGALITGAMLTGGLGGTGFAAPAAAGASADKPMAMPEPSLSVKVPLRCDIQGHVVSGATYTSQTDIKLISGTMILRSPSFAGSLGPVDESATTTRSGSWYFSEQH